MLTPVQWLIDFLICLAKFGVGLLLAGLVGLVNLFLAALMALLSPLLALLPEVDLGDVQPPDLLALANWLLPLDQFVLLTAVVLSLLGMWHVAAIALRWLKVVE